MINKYLLACSSFFLCCLHALTAVAAINSTEPTDWPAARWQPDKARFGMTIERRVPITMDDGAILYADIGYPAERWTGRRIEGEFPVILTQNPYNVPLTNNSVFQPKRKFVSRGYIYVVAQVRGTGRSRAADGGPVSGDAFGPRMAQDGVNLVHWAAHELPGSNGKVGLDGCSFLGITQLFTAAAVGPNSPVKAIAPACAGNGYELYFPSGLMAGTQTLANSANVAMLINGLRNFKSNVAIQAAINADYYREGPLAFKGEYWQQRDTVNTATAIVANNIPTLLWTGWQAAEARQALALYTALQNAAAQRPAFGPMTTEQRADGRFQLVMGPWGHGEGLNDRFMLAWFDHWLKDQATGIDGLATPLHFFEATTPDPATPRQRAGRWVNAARVPLTEAYTSLYLTSTGALSPTAAPAAAEPLSWVEPTASEGRLSYALSPFTTAQSLAGPMTVSVWVSTASQDAHLVATLWDVAPDGTLTKVSHGGLLASRRALDTEKSWYSSAGAPWRVRHQHRQNEYLTATAPVQIDIALLPAAWQFKPGHQLRLDLTAQAGQSNCNFIAALGQPWPCVLTDPQATVLPGGRYQIHTGSGYPSLLHVPLLSPQELSSAASLRDWGVPYE